MLEWVYKDIFRGVFISLLVGLGLPCLAAKTSIDVKKSTVQWTGKKVSGSHTGKVSIKGGFLDVEGQKAEAIVDLTSISIEDLTGEWHDKLLTHLKSEDFFGVDKFKTATLKLNKIEKLKGDKYRASGVLTIKDKSAPVQFEVSKKGDKYEGELVFNRTKYGMNFRSGSFFENLGDKLIYDDVTLKFSIALAQ